MFDRTSLELGLPPDREDPMINLVDITEFDMFPEGQEDLELIGMPNDEVFEDLDYEADVEIDFVADPEILGKTKKKQERVPKVPGLVGDMTWQRKAACREPTKSRSGVDQESAGHKPSPEQQLVFDGEELRLALVRPVIAEFCGECAVRKECLQYALDNPRYTTGVWGGMTEEARGRPKKA
ncbi:MAG TPA: WhiB family transcriptional regulator [Candidatus Saccharibacteria bacterium]|nr:WhiB family transcriptional regulator [Candidatus Saccharibacteria bacterium]